MFRKFFHWVGSLIKSIGSFIAGIFRGRNHDKEQYMKKSKDKLAKDETLASRELEDRYLARMKEHHDLARAEAAVGNGYRLHQILSEEATRSYDRYQDTTNEYFLMLEKEGADEAFRLWASAMVFLKTYVDYLDRCMANRSVVDQTLHEALGELDEAAAVG